MIQFNQVSKRYPGEIEALRSMNFGIEAGEMALLAGHSGAGKTTLLKLIAAIERPSFGTVVVNGQPVSSMGRLALPFLRRHIGFIFQDHKILFDRTVYDNVILPLDIVGFNRRDAQRRVRAALDKVGLLGKAWANPVSLSGGEQQRLCIARAVVHRPRILLADEPTGNLDRDYAADILDLFYSFHQVGVTVIVSAHDESQLAPYLPRVLRLHRGALTQDLPYTDALAQAQAARSAPMAGAVAAATSPPGSSPMLH